MILNEDYRDILQAFNVEQVDFILVGAYALAAHGYPRATMDICLHRKTPMLSFGLSHGLVPLCTE